MNELVYHEVQLLVYHEVQLMVKSLNDLTETCKQHSINLSSLRLPNRVYRWGNLQISRTPIRTLEATVEVHNAKFFLNRWFKPSDAQYLIEKLGTPANIWSAIQAFREIRHWCEQKKRRLQDE